MVYKNSFWWSIEHPFKLSNCFCFRQHEDSCGRQAQTPGGPAKKGDQPAQKDGGAGVGT